MDEWCKLLAPLNPALMNNRYYREKAKMNNVLIAAEKLTATFKAHRERERVTCRSNCWCWDVQELLIALEALQEKASTDYDQFCLYCKGVHDVRLACPEWIKAMEKVKKRVNSRR